MMMHGKVCLLLVILFAIVVHSNYVEHDVPEGGVDPLDSNDKGKDKDKDKDDEQWKVSSRRHRYPPYGSSLGNYRTRSRWSPSQEDFADLNDWTQSGLGGSGFPSSYPITLPSVPFDNSALRHSPSVPFDNPALRHSPSVPFDNPALRHSPSCYPLIDLQYPLFSDICGAVPQARYSLPNAFGQRERWQIAQTLTTLMSQVAATSHDPMCTRSLRLLICPLLFSPCQNRYESAASLPCQPFCRSVKLQCASPTLDLLPCDFLPPVSDICPVPAPAYGPFGSPSAYSSLAAAQSLASLSGGLSSPFLSGSLPGATPTAATTSPLNFYNSGGFGTDNLTPLLVDFPPRTLTNDYRQATRYATPTRSSADKY